MILDRLTLHNFGLYRGRHSFELTPLPGKPVILFVGLNGAGKTTILTALQLAFYGAQAPAVRHAADVGGYTFEDYLLDCINYDEPPADSASIEVEFHATRHGQEQQFLIRRSWRRVCDPLHLREGMAAHRVEVFVDGRADAAHAAAWSEVVEELLPLRLSTLFFFDGEKIDEWSNWQATEQLLSDAVRSLLGLDLVDRAIVDLETIARKANEDGTHHEAGGTLHALREQLRTRREMRAAVEQQLAVARDAALRAEEKIKELEPRLVAGGILLFDRKAEILALHDAARERLERVRGEERHRRKTARLDRHEQERFRALLQRRDGEMLASAPSEIRDWLHNWTETHPPCDFSCSPEDAANPPQNGTRDNGHEERRKLKCDVARLRELLLQIPDEAGALGLLQARNNALRDLERTKLRAEDISDSIRVIDQSLKSLVEDLDRCSIAASEKARSRDATARCSEAANSARSALCKFRSQLVCAYCTELEAGFRQSFQALLEKKDLFDAVRIKPTNSRASAHFKVVFEICGREVQSIRFSAAERQMLTLALLWTLVRASGRRAPLVIDTPLARLDQIHRANVANGYVRHARDQLIALATDADYEVLKTSNEIARIIGLAETAR